MAKCMESIATKHYYTTEQETDTATKRNMKTVMLRNNMKVMIINDHSVSRISVALDIHIGNFSNPDDFPGLAHLCQRMIILGNKKYPKYKEFQKLVQKHGGDILLTTSAEHTTYYFYIYTSDKFILEYVLYRFAQLFISMPLFKDSWIEKEIRMMDSKLEKELLHDTAWFEYFERATVKSTHPYSKYGLCKKQILTEMPMNQIKFRLIDFFQKYYSANIMTLCIVSDFIPYDAQKRILKVFNVIPNWEITIIKNYNNPFEDQLCTEWYIAPKTSTRHLRLIFPLPDSKEDSWREAINCISTLFKCNDKNSLLETLKAKNWCNDISIEGYQEAEDLNFFRIIITLSSNGYCHIYEIVALVFEYFNLFETKYLKTPSGLQELQEILIDIYNKRLKEEKQTFTRQRIIKVVKRLHDYSTKNILINRCLNKVNDIASMIKLILNNYISPQIIRIYVIKDDFKNLTSKSPGWDNANYVKWKIQKLTIDRWMEPSFSGLLLPDLKNIHLYKNILNKKVELSARVLVAKAKWEEEDPTRTFSNESTDELDEPDEPTLGSKNIAKKTVSHIENNYRQNCCVSLFFTKYKFDNISTLSVLYK